MLFEKVTNCGSGSIFIFKKTVCLPGNSRFWLWPYSRFLFSFSLQCSSSVHMVFSFRWVFVSPTSSFRSLYSPPHPSPATVSLRLPSSLSFLFYSPLDFSEGLLKPLIVCLAGSSEIKPPFTAFEIKERVCITAGEEGGSGRRRAEEEENVDSLEYKMVRWHFLWTFSFKTLFIHCPNHDQVNLISMLGFDTH